MNISDIDSDRRRNRMFKTWFSGIVAAFFAVLVMAVPVWSADSGDVIVELSAQKVIKGPDGREKFESAEKSAPGEIIEYTVVYRNKGKAEVKNLLGTLPVPQGMEYLPATSKPEKVTASLDGKIYGNVPLKKKVKMPNGREETREVPYGEYRFLRWDLISLPAGQSVRVSARMRLLANVAPLKSQDVTIIKK